MRRTEIAALDIGVGLFDIVVVLFDGMTEPTDMVMGVIAYLMTFCNDPLIQVGIFPYVVAHHKEGGFDIKLLERIKDEGGGLWDRTVVKGQIDCPFTTVHPPEGFGV